MLKIYCKRNSCNNGSPAVRALLEEAYFSMYAGVLPLIEKTPNGKPFFPEKPDVHFSLSHSRLHVMCAISSSPIGVDIESIRPVSERAIRFFCSPDEIASFDPLDLWVLKESYIKMFGLVLPSVREARFTRDGNRIISPVDFVASALYRVDGCPAAVSVIGETLPDSAELVIGSIRRF